jgi:hypothetical protein
MNNYKNLIVLLVISTFILSCNKKDDVKAITESETEYPNRYYIDPDQGEYYNTAHSPSQAWESVNRINDKVWKAGDTILIKRGTRYSGSLILRGNGTALAPIVITAYGDENLPLPEINAEGKKDEGILIKNVQYWEIQNLKITNKGAEERPKSYGIHIVADNIEGGVMNGIHIKNCVIADVYGTKSTQLGGGGAGIFYYNRIESPTPSSFNDLRVEHCQIINCQRDGLAGYLSTGNRALRKANTNFVFSNNLFEGVPGDVLLVNGCDDALVEYNIVRKCEEGIFSPAGAPNKLEPAAAVWCMHSDNTKFRYNIVQDHKATWDGQAFDCDQNSQNTLFEYNITYNNVGGFMLLCPSDLAFNQGFVDYKGLVVRYNISINDGTRNYLKENGKALSSTIDVVGRVVDAHFYNNTFIKTKSVGQNADNRAITFDSFTNLPASLRFTNNIFYNTTTTANLFYEVNYGQPLNTNAVVFKNNAVYGYSNDIPINLNNTGNITNDPQFVKLIDSFLANNNLVDKQEILDGLKLAIGSPLINKGVSVADPLFPLSNDFWGISIGDTKNIGPFNHQ